MVDQVKDGKITEDDDDEELIPVETPPVEPAKEEKTPPAADDHEDDHEDDDDGEDTRLGASEEDSEDEIVSANRKRRKERNEARKRARDRTERELRELRELNNQLVNRLSAVETNTLAHNETALEQQLAAVQREIAQTEIIIAKATEAGNGDDVVTALRLREEAMSRAQQLNYAKQQVAQVRQQPQQQQAPSPQVVNYARQWMEANPWYNPASNDEASRVTTQIDAQIVRDGYDPASVEYWQELTRRVGEQLADDDDDTGETRRSQRSESPRRKAPPTGGNKEHAPVSTRKEIYVTPERKQAMVDAGIWDDPARRNRMLKQYQAYDRENRR